ncbi:hypothetical protein CHARACLAT_026603 [Characodon lateralis]|uniref:Uncharacterized protein n=1 Tax=Characodon lateralis TaxID=208331 RepID=A0ABU7CUW3_9TELE|nr:hypothetical protein [Characodon lateralis]
MLHHSVMTFGILSKEAPCRESPTNRDAEEKPKQLGFHLKAVARKCGFLPMQQRNAVCSVNINASHCLENVRFSSDGERSCHLGEGNISLGFRPALQPITHSNIPKVAAESSGVPGRYAGRKPDVSLTALS